VIAKASERLYSIVQHVSQLTEKVRIQERDLVKMQQLHIQSVGKLLEEETQKKNSNEGNEKLSE
jgi:hypothetical protein